MDRKTAEQYGAGLSLVDAEPVDDPTTELGAPFYQRLAEDVAQLTRPPCRAIIVWTTTSVGTPLVARIKTIWGDTGDFNPVVVRNTDGEYTLTFSASYLDGLAVAETVAWFAGHSEIGDRSLNKAITEVTGAVVNVFLFDDTGAASDFTPDVTEITTFLY